MAIYGSVYQFCAFSGRFGQFWPFWPFLGGGGLRYPGGFEKSTSLSLLMKHEVFTASMSHLMKMDRLKLCHINSL